MKKLIACLLVVFIVLSCFLLVACNYELKMQFRDELQPVKEKLGPIINQMAGKTEPKENESDEPSEIEWEEKIYAECDIFSDFVPGELLVRLDKAISVPHQLPDVSFFEGVEVVEIVDLDKPWNTHYINGPDYRQRIEIKLSDKYQTKFATLQAMYILESVEGIYSVQPNYIYHRETNNYYIDSELTPNDEYYSFSNETTNQWALEKIEIEKVWNFSIEQNKKFHIKVRKF